MLGLVFLAVTGAEALYADLGHSGAGRSRSHGCRGAAALTAQLSRPRRTCCWPTPMRCQNPFYKLYPELGPGADAAAGDNGHGYRQPGRHHRRLSLTRQAMQLGLLPRYGIKHTSEIMAGQIYLPAVNWVILTAVLLVVMMFQSSSRSPPLTAWRSRLRWSSTA